MLKKWHIPSPISSKKISPKPINNILSNFVIFWTTSSLLVIIFKFLFNRLCLLRTILYQIISTSKYNSVYWWVLWYLLCFIIGNKLIIHTENYFICIFDREEALIICYAGFKHTNSSCHLVCVNAVHCTFQPTLFSHGANKLA